MARTPDGYPIHEARVRREGSELVVTYVIAEKGQFKKQVHRLQSADFRQNGKLPAPKPHKP